VKIRIQHRTTYNYREPVSFGQHKIMVRPREGHDLHIESSVLEISPAHTIHWMRDVNGNSLAVVDFQQKAAQLSFYSEIVLHHYDANPLDFVMDAGAVEYPFVYYPDSQPELAAFITLVYPKDAARLREWLTQFWRPGDKIQTIELLMRVNQFINRNFKYQRRDEMGVQTPGQTLALRSGSCRDFATLLLESCRCWGLAARFVSGYMQCEATEAGGASTHAWVEVYLPGAGWKGFDPTSGMVTGAQYVAVAVSRDPENASPIAGSFVGPNTSFLNIQVNVSVVQLDRTAAVSAVTPTPTVPLSNQQPRKNPASMTEQTQQMAQQAPRLEMQIQPRRSQPPLPLCAS
jgi:transglutaminase-like putative cysteine protease